MDAVVGGGEECVQLNYKDNKKSLISVTFKKIHTLYSKANGNKIQLILSNLKTVKRNNKQKLYYLA